MTKHDWFWVFLKAAGVAALLSSLFALTAIVTVLGDLPFGSILVRLLINVGAMGAAGVWLIRDGNLLIEWAKASDRGSSSGAS
jgi:hypothetical protein